jgi:hypothetical protein
LAFLGQRRPAYASAILVFIAAIIDPLVFVIPDWFESIKTIEDLLFIAIFAIMAGASHDMDGRYISNFTGGRNRFSSGVFNLQTGRTISPRSSMPARDDSKSNNLV